MMKITEGDATVQKKRQNEITLFLKKNAFLCWMNAEINSIIILLLLHRIISNDYHPRNNHFSNNIAPENVHRRPEICRTNHNEQQWRQPAAKSVNNFLFIFTYLLLLLLLFAIRHSVSSVRSPLHKLRRGGRMPLRYSDPEEIARVS